jgi:hypothetical protein
MTDDERDADRLTLLDRIAERIPWLDLDQESIEWTTLDDGHEALVVNGGGFDGGDGASITNCGEDLHVVGVMAPLIPDAIGCIVIRPDGSRYVARTVPDPLAEQ